MTEYVMLVGLVAILMVGAVKGLQASVGGAFDKATQVIVDVGEATASGGDESDPAMAKLNSRMRVSRERAERERAERERAERERAEALRGP